ncbi:MAG: metal-dependent hydrolase [Chloroflexi bacterium]|nr:metal-dependent hydrolase [Chloroflexota bacterium]
MPSPERARERSWLAAGLIFAMDTLFWRFDPPRAVAAVMDESAHAATALLLLDLARLPASEPVLAGTLLGAVVIDVDHIPSEVGWDILTNGTGRPYTHSLFTLGESVLLAFARPGPWRTVALSAAFGIVTHLLRDMATGGVPLYWPLARRSVTIPYIVYAILVFAAATAGRRFGEETVT